MSEQPEYLIVGEIVGAFGTRGEVKLRAETQFPERFRPGTAIWVGHDKTKYEIETSRPHRGVILLKLDGVNRIEEAEALHGALAFVPFAEAVPLEDGSYYHYQLVGLRVATDKGEELGEVTEVIVTGSNDVFVVMGKFGEVLIPATKEVIKSISPEAGTIVVTPIDGLMAAEEHGE